LHGSSWVVAERVWLLLSSLVIGIWTVRALGPEQYGPLSLALSITSVFAAVATVGLDNALLHVLASQPTRAREAYAAAIGLRALGAAIHIGLCALVAGVLFSDQFEVMVMTVIAASAALFRILDAATLQWQVDQQYRSAVELRVATRVAGDLARVALLLLEAGALWFAAAMVLEAMVGSLILFVRTRPEFAGLLSASRSFSKPLLRQGLPVVVSGLVSAMYARFDQLTISRVLGPEVNGSYAAAVRISEIFTIFAVSIGSVALPLLSAEQQRPVFERRIVQYMRLMLIAGILIAAGVSILADEIVQLLYGARYASAGAILATHVWTVPLIFASVATEPWFYQQGRVSLYVFKATIGLGFCIPAVLLAMEHWGPSGVALAVVLTYFTSVFMTNLVLPSARPLLRLQLEAAFGWRTGDRR
jgi:PST family polysaccharide transporter